MHGTISLSDILSMSLSPSILISGIGLIMLSLNNRWGRIVNRLRIVTEEIKQNVSSEIKNKKRQQELLFKRLKTFRMSIIFGTICAFFISLVMISLFIMGVFELFLDYLIIFLFSLSFLSLTFSLIFYVKDIYLSSKAIIVEMDRL